jgi:CHRD domain
MSEGEAMPRQLLVFAALLAISILSAASARGAVTTYTAVLTGPGESPTNNSPGTGLATVDVDPTAHTMHVHVDFIGLTGTTTASHIHSPTTTPLTGTANVATTTPTFAGFPLGVTSGTYDNTLDMTQASSYNPAFITSNGGSIPASETALFNSIAAGTSYLNIHTSTFPGGEIRGFLVVPEPASLGLLACAGLMLVRRRCCGR